MTNSATTSSQSGIIGMIPIILVFLIFYFLLIRPQAKRIQELEKKRENLQKGDRILTGGGLFATVEKIEEEIVYATVSPQTSVEILRSTIMDVLKKK